MRLDLWFSADSYNCRFILVRISMNRLDFSFTGWVLWQIWQIKCTKLFRPGLCPGPRWGSHNPIVGWVGGYPTVPRPEPPPATHFHFNHWVIQCETDKINEINYYRIYEHDVSLQTYYHSGRILEHFRARCLQKVPNMKLLYPLRSGFKCPLNGLLFSNNLFHQMCKI